LEKEIEDKLAEAEAERLFFLYNKNKQLKNKQTKEKQNTNLFLKTL
jgi:hypothetical protein